MIRRKYDSRLMRYVSPMVRSLRVYIDVGGTKGKLHTWIQSIAALASICAVALLIWANFQTQQQIELQRQGLSNVDSTVAVIRQQVGVLQEQNDLQREFNIISRENKRESSDRFLEDNKPEVELAGADCKIVGNIFRLHLNFNNHGKSTAEEVTRIFALKPIDVNIPPVYVDTTVFSPLPAGTSIIEKLPTNISRGDYLIRVKLNWKWKAVQKNYTAVFYRILRCSTNDSTCNTYAEPESEAVNNWKNIP